jgi:hypothetical protein
LGFLLLLFPFATVINYDRQKLIRRIFLLELKTATKHGVKLEHNVIPHTYYNIVSKAFQAAEGGKWVCNAHSTHVDSKILIATKNNTNIQ